MVIELDLPENILPALTADNDGNLTRRVLESLAIEGYREHKLTQKQVGELLGLSRIATEDFLAKHVDLYDYDPSEIARETNALRTFSERRP
jgi:predicted HTH domain antitoxin